MGSGKFLLYMYNMWVIPDYLILNSHYSYSKVKKHCKEVVSFMKKEPEFPNFSILFVEISAFLEQT